MYMFHKSLLAELDSCVHLLKLIDHLLRDATLAEVTKKYVSLRFCNGSCIQLWRLVVAVVVIAFNVLAPIPRRLLGNLFFFSIGKVFTTNLFHMIRNYMKGSKNKSDYMNLT